MSNDWENIKIKDIADINIETYSSKEDWDFVNYLDTSNITENKIDEIKFIDLTKEKLPSRAKRKVQEFSILFSTVRPNQKHYGIIKESIENFLVSTAFVVINADKTKADPYFLYYLLIQDEIIEFLSMIAEQSTSAYPSIKSSNVENLEFLVPPLKEQQKISKILSSLDEKIEINRKMNENLEEQAKEIFKRWFVDYEFPNEEGQPYKSSGGEMIESELGLIPKGWEKINLGDICICELGGTPSRKKNEYWNGNIPWINSGSVNLFRIIKANEMISELGLKKSSTKLLPKKTTVIAITGSTLGQVSLLEIDSCTNQSVVGVIPNKNLPYEFIYPYIKANIGELLSHKTGGAQQHINSQNVKNLKVIVPNKKSLEQYTDLISPIYEMISKNCFEIEYLSSIRDELLPKLMIGEIDVSEIDI